VDSTQITLDDNVQLQLRIEGRSAQEPQLPALNDFDIQGTGKSSQVSIINGSISASTVYSYALQPKRLGALSIPAISVQIDDKTYQSRPITVQVTRPGSGAGAPSQTPTPQNGPDADPNADPNANAEQAVFATAEVSGAANPEAPYVGESLIYTLRFYHRVRISGAEASWPTFDGFLTHDLGKREPRMVVINGLEYALEEVRTALYPQEAGTRVIKPTELKVGVLVSNQRNGSNGFFDDFFNRAQQQTRVVRTQPVTLQVQALPSGAPASFSGLVGQFAFTAQLSKNTVSVGDSVTLTLTVSGNGNLDQATAPQLPTAGAFDSFKIYDENPVTPANAANQAATTGSRVFTKALVPSKAGEFVLPSLPFTYFDPQARAYKTIDAGPLTLTVTPAKAAEDLRLTGAGTGTGTGASAQASTPAAATDTASSSNTSWSIGAACAAFAALAALATLAAFAFTRWRKNHNTPEARAERRRKAAAKHVQHATAEVERLLKTGGSTAERAAYEAITRGLRRYVGDKYGNHGFATAKSSAMMAAADAMTTTDVMAMLREAGSPQTTLEAVTALMHTLDAAQYGASGATSAEQVRTALKSMQAVTEAMK
jgi:hypothetical protein